MDQETLYKELGKINFEMTPDDRIREYLKGNRVDCIPNGFRNPGDAMAAMWGISKGELHRSFDARVELTRRMAEEYGIKEINISLGLRGLGEAVGSIVKYPENRTDYVEKGILQDYKDICILDDFRVSKSKLFGKVEEAKKMKKIFPDFPFATNVAGPLSTAISIRPMEMVLKDFVKNKKCVNRLLDFSVDATLRWVKYFHSETGCTKVGIADPVTTTDILGRRYFEQYSKEYLRKLIIGIKSITGNKPAVHICGHSEKIWNDFAEIGIDNLSIDNCESLENAKKKIGDKMFIAGNIPPVDVMRMGTIDDVIKAVRKSIEEGADSPKGFMVTTGCQVPIGTPKQNFDASIYASYIYGKDAVIGKKPESLGLFKGNE